MVITIKNEVLWKARICCLLALKYTFKPTRVLREVFTTRTDWKLTRRSISCLRLRQALRNKRPARH